MRTGARAASPTVCSTHMRANSRTAPSALRCAAPIGSCRPTRPLLEAGPARRSTCGTATRSRHFHGKSGQHATLAETLSRRQCCRYVRARVTPVLLPGSRPKSSRRPQAISPQVIATSASRSQAMCSSGRCGCRSLIRVRPVAVTNRSCALPRCSRSARGSQWHGTVIGLTRSRRSWSAPNSPGTSPLARSTVPTTAS